MLSYRHGFHAGNPADVFKHTVLIALIRAMQHKPGGIRFIDTHAGAAIYDLDNAFARKNREFERGVGALWGTDAGPGPLADYLDAVARHNPEGQLLHYPGSSQLLFDLKRDQDELVLCELHPSEQRELQNQFAGKPGMRVVCGDGYAALGEWLPPPGGRALVLIDPPFELKTELEDLERALKTALKRFGHGVYAIWYPVIEGKATTPDALPTSLDLDGERWLDLRIEFTPLQRLGRMHGCGMAIVNCPFRARESLVAWVQNWNA